MAKKIVVGLSGGVDSSVAALILKEQGYDVHGLFMVNWHDRVGTLTSNCSWEDDWEIAQMVARKLDIPITKIDLSEYYRDRVVDYMFKEYAAGRTPNPDVLCNREIKFDVFLQKALEIGAEFVATGHYCRKSTTEINGLKHHHLLAGLDSNKDQSYFLCQLNQWQLSKSIFPIGELIKSEVRDLALKANLPTATRKDSQGICFVGKVDLPLFLQQKLETKNGYIVELERSFYKQLPCNGNYVELSKPITYKKEDGEVVGEHEGAHFYTIGQRKGLGVGGKPQPLFVIGTDIKDNIVYVGQGHDFPGLLRKSIFLKYEDIHYLDELNKLNVGDELKCSIRIRYRQPLQSGTIHCHDEGLYFHFEEPQRAVAPGQFIAWYMKDELLGSGPIYS